MLVLVVLGLVILGPERLPGAIRWTANTIRQARDYLTGATQPAASDLGRSSTICASRWSELQRLRGMSPRAALTKHLLDGDDSWLTSAFDAPGDEAAERADADGAARRPTPPVAPRCAGAPAPYDADATLVLR